jgi:hypothetical protein
MYNQTLTSTQPYPLDSKSQTWVLPVSVNASAVMKRRVSGHVFCVEPGALFDHQVDAADEI